MENNKRPESMERITTPALAEAFIQEQLSAIRRSLLLFRHHRLNHSRARIPASFSSTAAASFFRLASSFAASSGSLTARI